MEDLEGIEIPQWLLEHRSPINELMDRYHAAWANSKFSTVDDLVKYAEAMDSELVRLREIEVRYNTRVMPSDSDLRLEFEEMILRDGIDLDLQWDDFKHRFIDEDTFDAFLYYGLGARRGE